MKFEVECSARVRLAFASIRRASKRYSLLPPPLPLLRTLLLGENACGDKLHGPEYAF